MTFEELTFPCHVSLGQSVMVRCPLQDCHSFSKLVHLVGLMYKAVIGSCHYGSQFGLVPDFLKTLLSLLIMAIFKNSVSCSPWILFIHFYCTFKKYYCIKSLFLLITELFSISSIWHVRKFSPCYHPDPFSSL